MFNRKAKADTVTKELAKAFDDNRSASDNLLDTIKCLLAERDQCPAPVRLVAQRRPQRF